MLEGAALGGLHHGAGLGYGGHSGYGHGGGKKAYHKDAGHQGAHSNYADAHSSLAKFHPPPSNRQLPFLSGCSLSYRKAVREHHEEGSDSDNYRKSYSGGFVKKVSRYFPRLAWLPSVKLTPGPLLARLRAQRRLHTGPP